jgi:hypothetical protein
MPVVDHPGLEKVPGRFRQIAETALSSPFNRLAVMEPRRVDEGWLSTRIGQNTLIEHFILTGGVGPLSAGARAFLARTSSN